MSELFHGEYPIHIRKNKRAKRLTLSISRATGKINLTAPDRAPMKDLRTFVASHSGWLDKALSNMAPETVLKIGAKVPILGKERIIKSVGGDYKKPVLTEDAILLYGDPATAQRRLGKWLVEYARTCLSEASSYYASQINKTPKRISIRDTTSRWGSCSSNGSLSYSWRLILAPENVLEYVAAHEVAHLKHMDHSERFWSVVADLRPTYDAERKWLRVNGPSLHRYKCL